MNSLQKIELLEVEDMNALSEEETKFQITDINSLNWAFRKLSALKSKEKEIKQLVAEEQQRISMWESGELSTVKSSSEFFENMIAQYHTKQLEADPKAKTISTPYGKSKTRASKEAPDKEDEEAILQHVIENEMDDFVKKSLKWADFKKSVSIADVNGEKVIVDENGQVVPGATVKAASVSYTVEV